MILGDVGSGEILLLALVAVFVFGPDRLPKLAKDLSRALRQVRGMANSVRDEIRDEVGPEIADFDLSTLNPKTFVTKHLLSDEDVSSLDNALSLDKSLDKGPSGVASRPSRAPVKGLSAGGSGANGGAQPADRGMGAPGRSTSLSKPSGSRRAAGGPSSGASSASRSRSGGGRSARTPYDSDAT
ncbi:MAG: sec-independent translocase [Frankiaceae bacterium]